MIEAVVFDIGETLVDETRDFGAWADWLDVPRHTFSAVFGAVIAAGRHHREVFEHFQPGFDLAAERQRRAAAGWPEYFFEEADLYPDARPCLAALRELGLWVAVAGNQPSRAGDLLRRLDLAADLIATSEDWQVMKPEPGFFQILTEAAPCPAGRILHVGDRLDYDLRPAKAAGMQTAFIRRGPWGHIGEQHPDLDQFADWHLTTLADLPDRIVSARQSGG